MPLSLVAAGRTVRLVRLQGGGGFQHRLAEMGLVPGVRFTVIGRGSPGPCIVELKGGRLVLGRGMVNRIFVAPVGE